LTRVAEKVEMDSDSDSLLVEAVLGQMDSQNGFGFGARCFKNLFVDENLQYRRKLGKFYIETMSRFFFQL